MSTSYPEVVDADLARQGEALRRRISASGLYIHEAAEFAAARAAYRILWCRLRLTADFGSLTSKESRHVVRRVRRSNGDEAVVKITGHAREPGEGELLAAWYRLGLPCVEPLDWGYATVGNGRSRVAVTYVLTRWVELATLPAMTHGWPLARRVELCNRLVRFLRRFHEAHVHVPRARTWEDRLRAHMRWTLPLLAAQGWKEPHGWEHTLARLSAQGRCLIHGDPATSNVLVRDDGEMLLLDPAGAICGLPEIDAAQICSKVGGAEDIVEVVGAVCEASPALDPAAVASLVGLNFLTWAGYFLAGHADATIGNKRRQDTDDCVAEEAARRYLDVAHRLLTLGAEQP